MSLAIHYVIPTLLFLGASWLVMQEFLFFRHSPRKQWMRFGRRMVGGAALLVIAFMMHKGDTTLIFMEKEQAAALAQKDHAYVSSCLNYWFTLMGLVCGTVVLAVWDVIASLLNIRILLNEAARQDIKAFQEVLEKSQKSRRKGKKPTITVASLVPDPLVDPLASLTNSDSAATVTASSAPADPPEASPTLESSAKAEQAAVAGESTDSAPPLCPAKVPEPAVPTAETAQSSEPS